VRSPKPKLALSEAKRSSRNGEPLAAEESNRMRGATMKSRFALPLLTALLAAVTLIRAAPKCRRHTYRAATR
jgi:hypothetical protein